MRKHTLRESRGTHTYLLIGYVSDEESRAAPDVPVDFEQAGTLDLSVRSMTTGAVVGDIIPGPNRVTQCTPGFESKRVDITGSTYLDDPLPLQNEYAGTFEKPGLAVILDMDKVAPFTVD